MSARHTDTDREKLRAFEKKMHDEGAAGFADGPCPWETWDDKSGILGNNRVWEGSSKRIYPKKRTRPSLGDRVLSGLATLSLATMAVGIAGVYFSEPQPRQAAFTGVQPLPVDRAPPATDRVIASLEELPAPTAGETASGSDREAAAAPLPATPSAPAGGAAAVSSAPFGDSTPQATELPETTVDFAMPELAAPPAPDAGDPRTEDSVTAFAPAAPSPDTPPGGSPADLPLTVTADIAPPAAEPAAATDMLAEQPSPVATGLAAPDTNTGIILRQPAAVAITTTTPTATRAGSGAEPAAVPVTPVTTAATSAAEGTAGAAAATPAIVDAIAAPETDAGPAAPVATTAAAASIATATGTEIATTGLDAQPATLEDTAATAAVADDSAATVVAVPATAEQPPPTPPAAAAAAEIVPATKTGDWVVNLASYARESMASRMLKKFRDQGVDAELVSVMINDKPMYRIRVAGFASSRAARARISPLEQQLGLEGVWIGKK